MIHRIKFALVLLAFFALVGSILAANKPPSNTYRAERKIRIEANDQHDASDARSRMERMAASISPRGFSGEIYNLVRGISEVVGIKTDDAIGVVTVTMDPATQTAEIVVDLTHAPAGTKMLAAEAADRAVDELRNQLDSNPLRGQFENAERSMELLYKNREQSQMKMREAQEMLTKQTQAVDVSPGTMRQLLSSLQNQRESVEIDLSAKEARRDALAEQIASFSKQIEIKVTEDPVSVELAKVLEMRETALKRLEANPTVTSKAEIEAAAGALAEAKVKLLERREQAAAAAGGDILAGWNKELMSLSVDLAELKARAKTIDQRLDRFHGTSDAIRELEEYQGSVIEQNRQISEMNKRSTELRMDYARHRVGINVVSSEDQPAPTTKPAQ